MTTVLRRLFLVATPLVLAVALWWHPAGGASALPTAWPEALANAAPSTSCAGISRNASSAVGPLHRLPPVLPLVLPN